MKRTFYYVAFFVAVLFGSTACTLGQKLSNTASEAGDDAGVLVNKATGITDTAILKASEIAFATARAKEFYKAFKVQGEELSNGPCLSENLTSGWVADLVHNPRTVADDEPANQCQNFRNGTAKHFVELDLSGEFVRAQ